MFKIFHVFNSGWQVSNISGSVKVLNSSSEQCSHSCWACPGTWRNHFFYMETKTIKRRGSNFSGVKIHTNESISAHRHQYYSVLVPFYYNLEFFSWVFIHHSPTAEMETRLQSSSSSSGIIVFIYMKLLKHYMPHVPHRKVWLSAQFMGTVEGNQTWVQ